MKKLTLGVLLVLAACSEGPMAKAGVSQQEKDKDFYECSREAYAAGGAVGNASGYRRTANQDLYDACMTARGYKRS